MARGALSFSLAVRPFEAMPLSASHAFGAPLRAVPSHQEACSFWGAFRSTRECGASGTRSAARAAHGRRRFGASMEAERIQFLRVVRIVK